MDIHGMDLPPPWFRPAAVAPRRAWEAAGDRERERRTHGRDCEDCEEERPSESAAKRMAAESIWSGFEFTTHAEFRDRVKHPYIPRSLVLDGYVPQTLRWEQILGGFGIACAVVAGKITSTNAHTMHQTAALERFLLQKQRRWMWRQNSMSTGNFETPER